jgi:biopolymer transport protein ExbD
MAFSTGGRGRTRSEINVTPLVDVVLVLLIIFMVLAPVLLKQLPVQVPEKADVTPAPPTTPDLVLQVAADGALRLDGEPVARAALAGRVRERLAGRSDPLFLDIDDRANYGLVVELMDTCRGAGARTLGVLPR